MSETQSGSGLDRRGFLKSLAGLGGAWVSTGCAPGALAGGAGAGGLVSADRIGLQLYTVRDQLEKDFAGTLERVAQLGYKELEFAGYHGWTPEQVQLLLGRLGLTAPSSHVAIELLRQGVDAQLRAARTVGHQYLTIPYLQEADRPGAVEGWQRLAAEITRYAGAARAQGLRLAYHNHDFELAPLPGGRTGLEVLLAETDPALVDFELDLYWTVFAGRDPVALFRQFPGRFAMWHVKDMRDRQGSKPMAPVGEGEIDFRAIFARAAEAGMRHYFVEHDTAAQYPGGSLVSIEHSIRNLRQLLS